MIRILPTLALLLLICPALAAAPAFVHCFDFGCKTTVEVEFSAADWRAVRNEFIEGVVDAESERQAIRRAVARMERISGDIAGTRLDKAGNYPGYDLPKQMDCIDESTNTYQYLFALEQLELLRWHRIDLKHRRIVWLATHWTASIREIDTDRVFAVDSWYRDNGEMPYLQPIDEWKRRRDFSSEFNPELALK